MQSPQIRMTTWIGLTDANDRFSHLEIWKLALSGSLLALDVRWWNPVPLGDDRGAAQVQHTTTFPYHLYEIFLSSHRHFAEVGARDATKWGHWDLVRRVACSWRHFDRSHRVQRSR